MGKTRALAVLAALGVVASAPGCWLQAGFDSGRTAYNDRESTVTAANVAGLEVAWTASVGATRAREAIVDRGTAYVRTAGGLTALDVSTGGTRWAAAALPGLAIPAIVTGQLVVPTDGTPCHAVTLDQSSGAVVATRNAGLLDDGLWCAAADALVVGSRLIVPFQGAGGRICAYHQGFPVPESWDDVGFSMLDYASQPVDDASAYNRASAGCGYINLPPPPVDPLPTSVGTSGELLWPSDPLAATTLSASPIDCVTSCPTTWTVAAGDGASTIPAVALAGGSWALASQGALSVVDGTSHSVTWSAALGSVVSLAATPTTLYAGMSDGTVAAYPVAGCGGSTCGPSWTAALGGSADWLSAGGDVLYAGAGTEVAALPAAGCGAATCPSLWSYDLGAAVSGRPVIDGGTLVVSSDDGSVTAFRVPVS